MDRCVNVKSHAYAHEYAAFVLDAAENAIFVGQTGPEPTRQTQTAVRTTNERRLEVCLEC